MLIFFISAILIYIFLTYIFFIVLCRKFNNKIVNKIRYKCMYKNTSKYRDKIDIVNKWLEEQTIEKVFIKSYDNLTLNGLLINNEKGKGVMIVFHGYRSDATNHLFLSYPYFYDLGYSILLINQRTCMDSEGKYITFGAKEKDDVLSWIKYSNENYKNQDIILAGISMGATGLILSTKNITKDMNVKLLIADSGYISGCSSIKECFKSVLHINGTIFMPGINIWCRLFAGFNLKDTNVLSDISNCDVPLLVFHNKRDRFVSVDNSIKIYETYPGEKDLVLFEESGHATCYLSEPDKYINSINKYILK